MKRLEDVFPDHPKGGLLYLATCFRKHSRGLYQAYYEAREVTGALWKRDIDCYSPIAACYQTALFEEIDLVDNEFWLRRNLPHMRASRALVILRHDNWEKSDGIKEEIDFFDKRNSPIYSLDYPVVLK